MTLRILRDKILLFLLFMAATVRAVDTNSPAVIPAPRKVELRDGVFKLAVKTPIRVDRASRETGEYLAARLRASTGFPFQVNTARAAVAVPGAILLTTARAKADLGAEGYELSVSPDAVVVRAPEQAGLFYGVQSLLELLPVEVFAARPASSVNWTIPCVRIEDQPRFKWRGLMLDVSRHFFNQEEVKQLLEAMALHKLNTFHWHLVDDQGWRIEIKKHPRLTQVAAWRKSIGFGLDPRASTAYGPDGRYGGYYTQADIREVVAYARSRHITIVPEIEMPGHSVAALSAYPQLSCFGGPYDTDLSGGIYNGVYCAGKDEAFDFLGDVLAEVCKLFPGQYIHIGGDEVPKENWQKCPRCQARMRKEGLKTEHELQSYFVRRIEQIVNRHGHNLIGWSEIREGGLAQSAAVMDWVGGAAEAAGAGHNVVMSPTAYCYFDYYQSSNNAAEPRAIGGFLPMKKVYSFEPVPAELPPQFHVRILGAQANLWTEYIPSLEHAEYMIFPRLTALSEVVWSPAAARDWADFSRRLQTQYERFDQFGIHYRRYPLDSPETSAPQ